MACVVSGPAHILSDSAQPCSEISPCAPCSHQCLRKPTLVSLTVFCLIPDFGCTFVHHFRASYSLHYQFVMGVTLISLARLPFKLEGCWKGMTDPLKNYEPLIFCHSAICEFFQHLFKTSILCTNYSCHVINLRTSWGWMWLYADPEVLVVPMESIMGDTCDTLH